MARYESRNKKQKVIKKKTLRSQGFNTQEIQAERVKNESKSIDELMIEFQNISVKITKRSKRIKKSKNVPRGSSMPRIVKAKLNRSSTRKKAEDDVSVKNNKYHKRHVKTKKPTKL